MKKILCTITGHRSYWFIHCFFFIILNLEFFIIIYSHNRGNSISKLRHKLHKLATREHHKKSSSDISVTFHSFVSQNKLSPQRETIFIIQGVTNSSQFMVNGDGTSTINTLHQNHGPTSQRRPFWRYRTGKRSNIWKKKLKVKRKRQKKKRYNYTKCRFLMLIYKIYPDFGHPWP